MGKLICGYGFQNLSDKSTQNEPAGPSRRRSSQEMLRRRGSPGCMTGIEGPARTR